MKFSVIMPSFMGEYKGAAKNREQKIIRAVESVIKQTYENWELIIIADGCQKTVDILNEWYANRNKPDLDIVIYRVPKQRLWGGIRNYGIDKATGDYIIYLDIDDTYTPTYLSELNAKMVDDKDWYWCNDIKMMGNKMVIDYCDVNKLGKCGTSNIIHKPTMKARWMMTDYAEDWQFIKSLKKESENYRFVNVAGYEVRHIPNKYDI